MRLRRRDVAQRPPAAVLAPPAPAPAPTPEPVSTIIIPPVHTDGLEKKVEALGEMITKYLANLPSAARAVPYEFKVIRTSDGFIQRVIATPLKQ